MKSSKFSLILKKLKIQEFIVIISILFFALISSCKREKMDNNVVIRGTSTIKRPLTSNKTSAHKQLNGNQTNSDECYATFGYIITWAGSENAADEQAAFYDGLQDVLQGLGATAQGIPTQGQNSFGQQNALDILAQAWLAARTKVIDMPISPISVEVTDLNIQCVQIPTNPQPEEIITDSLDAKFPCVKKVILNKLFTNLNLWTLVTLPFMSSESGAPKLNWNATPQVYGTGGSYALGEASGTGYSATINLNSAAIVNASELYVAAGVIHETVHGYINYIINTGKYGTQNIDAYAWGGSVEAFTTLDSLHQAGLGNYVDHSLFLEGLYDDMVNVLSDYAGTKYTKKECQMAMLFGLNNPGIGVSPTDPVAIELNRIYNKIKTTYGITSAELNSFNTNNLIGVPLDKKVPTSCP